MAEVVIDAMIEPRQVDELAHSAGLTVALAEPDHESCRALPSDLIKDARAMLCMFLPENHVEMRSLEFVQLCSAGFSQVERLGLTRRGVKVCTASGVNDIPIAEWSIAMMIAVVRDFQGLFDNQRHGKWNRDARFQSEIRGRTLGIWGYGGIGRETARLARALGLRVHVLTRNGQIDTSTPRFRAEGTGDDTGVHPHRVFALSEVEDFCRSLDFLLLAIPQTPQNVGIVNREIFECLPKTAYLLNPARGPLVNEADLLHALRTGLIAGAALDTHFKYPMPPDHPLWRMPNVIMTPHISGSSKSSRFVERLWQLFAENIRRWQSSERLLNQLTAMQLEGAG
jgi:phosphoglycerate dehydrogenase-like enzyme